MPTSGFETIANRKSRKHQSTFVSQSFCVSFSSVSRYGGVMLSQTTYESHSISAGDHPWSNAAFEGGNVKIRKRENDLRAKYSEDKTVLEAQCSLPRSKPLPLTCNMYLSNGLYRFLVCLKAILERLFWPNALRNHSFSISKQKCVPTGQRNRLSACKNDSPPGTKIKNGAGNHEQVILPLICQNDQS